MSLDLGIQLQDGKAIPTEFDVKGAERKRKRPWDPYTYKPLSQILTETTEPVESLNSKLTAAFDKHLFYTKGANDKSVHHVYNVDRL